MILNGLIIYSYFHDLHLYYKLQDYIRQVGNHRVHEDVCLMICASRAVLFSEKSLVLFSISEFYLKLELFHCKIRLLGRAGVIDK